MRFTTYNKNQRISGVLSLPEPGLPCVVTCHGFLSSKDSKKYVRIEREFTRNGIGVLRFDFRGCGDSEGRFEDTTLSGRISDLEAILDFLEPHTDSIGLFGSSLGGCVAALTSRDKRVEATVVLSTPFYLTELFSQYAKSFEEKGYYETPEFRIKKEFWDDLQTYQPEKAAQEVSHLLVIHGDSDELIPVRHAKGMYRLASEPKRLEIIKNADHRFTDPAHREEAIDLSLEWFKRYLSE